ncbi:MAG: xylan 1,4-beta-xylosidase [Gammaproteobacteria bacterium]|nr:xylan 1,4-beta-xylosidase [Gammaproteobacteria bacterium]
MRHLAQLTLLYLACSLLDSAALAAETSVDAPAAEVAMISAPGSPARIRAGDLRKITVDAGAPVGHLRSLQGVNGAPAPGAHKPQNFKFGGWNMPERIDVSAGYRMARIDLVRTHDAYGPTDIDAKFATADAPGGGLISARRDMFDIFPDPDADANDPRSYNFAPTDQIIASIQKVGAQVMFRLGRSEGSDAQPPKDFNKYAAIAKHIVMHYNRGWAKGFHYHIRYWEIWNEPDLGKVFWAGTAQQYYELYAKLARAVKSADPHALVGGPAIARPNDDTPYRDAFLEYVRTERLPLDFYSWHWYATDSDDPLDFIRISRDTRARLDKHGFAHTRSMVTEWNYGLMDPLPSAVQRASFITAALIYMQDAPIDAATLYRADSVFGADGATPDKTGQALIALGKLKDTPYRLRVKGADLNGFAVEAARSADGRTVQILLSNYQIPSEFLGPRAADDVLHVPPVFDVRLLARRSISYRNNSGYDLTIDHLPANRRYSVERCRISAANDFTSLGTALYTSAPIRLQNELPPPGIELVTIRAIDGTPGVAARRQTADVATPPIAAQEVPTDDHCGAAIAAVLIK